MARSISFDIAAADKASRALEQVAREVTDLERKLDGAGGTIEIDADTGRAHEQIAQIDAQLARLNAKSLKVDADIAAAKRDLQVLEAEARKATGDRKVKVDADIAAAQARLRALEAQKVSVDVETGAAQAKLRAVEQSLSRVDGDKATARVDVDAAGAVGGLARIGQQLRDISSPVKIAVSIQGGIAVLQWIASVASGLAAIGAAGVGAAGVTMAALQGVGDAVTELGQQDTATAGGMASNAHAVQQAIDGVARAQREVRNATEAVTEAQRAQAKAVEGVADAQRAVERASAGVVRAQRAVEAAVEDVSRAQEDSARAAQRVTRAQEEVGRATQRVGLAERDLADAQRDATRAQDSINDARRDAVRLLEDLQQRTTDMALDQESAALSVVEAQERLNEVMADPEATDTQRRRAELTVRQAEARRQALETESRRLAETKADADRKGVDGSDLVTAALDRQEAASRRVEDAQRGIEDAQRGVRDAQDGVAEAQRGYEESLRRIDQAQQAVADRTEAVADAQQTVTDRMRDVGEAQQTVEDRARGVRDAQEAVKDKLLAVRDAQWAVQDASKSAGAAGAGAAKSQTEAFDNLSLSGQRFALYLRALVDGPLKDLQSSAANGVLPGLQSGIEGFMSGLGDAETRVGRIAQRVGDFFDEVGPAAGRAAGAVLRLADIGSEATFDDLADAVVSILGRFTDWANSQSPQQISEDLHTIASDVQSLWDKAAFAFDAIQAAFDALDFPTNFLTAPFRGLIDLMSGGTWQDALAEPVEGMRNLYNSMQDLVDRIPGMKGVLPELSADFGRLDGATRGADRSTRDLAGTSRDLVDAQQACEEAVRDAKDEMLRGEEAALRYEETLGRTEDAVRRNGRAWELSSEKGRDNRSALLDLIKSSNDTITALQNQGAGVDTIKAKYQDQRQKLIDVAVQMGANRTQAQQYIDKLLQVPSERNTTLRVDNFDAMNKTQDLINRIGLVQGKTVTIQVQTNAANVREDRVITRSRGGRIPGAPSTVDSVHVLSAPGEYFVNAYASERNLPMLEAINRGASPAELAAMLPTAAPGMAAPVPAQRGGGGSGGGNVILQFSNVLVGQEDAVQRAVVAALGTAAGRGLLPPSLRVVTA